MSTKRHPLIEGFRQGVKPPLFDTSREVSPMPADIETNRALATRYGVSVRSIYRWARAGVNIHSPMDVAKHLLTQRAPKPTAMDAVIYELKTTIQ